MGEWLQIIYKVTKLKSQLPFYKLKETDRCKQDENLKESNENVNIINYFCHLELIVISIYLFYFLRCVKVKMDELTVSLGTGKCLVLIWIDKKEYKTIVALNIL